MVIYSVTSAGRASRLQGGSCGEPSTSVNSVVRVLTWGVGNRQGQDKDLVSYTPRLLARLDGVHLFSHSHVFLKAISEQKCYGNLASRPTSFLKSPA